jgi:hypothetical protein
MTSLIIDAAVQTEWHVLLAWVPLLLPYCFIDIILLLLVFPLKPYPVLSFTSLLTLGSIFHRVMDRLPGSRIAFIGDGPFRCALLSHRELVLSKTKQKIL